MSGKAEMDEKTKRAFEIKRHEMLISDYQTLYQSLSLYRKNFRPEMSGHGAEIERIERLSRMILESQEKHDTLMKIEMDAFREIVGVP